MTMNRTLTFAFLTFALFARVAAAQTEGRFQTGNVSWTPLLTLRDAGVDTNVYDEAADPKRDNLAIFSPQVDGTMTLGLGDVKFGGGADFVYFHRYTSERSINGRGTARLDLRFMRLKPFVSGGFLDSRDRLNSEIDSRSRRHDREAGAGLGLQVTSRATLEAAGRFKTSRYDEGETFLGIDLAQRLNRKTASASLGLRYEVTPLTQLVFEGAASQDRFTLSPSYDVDNLRFQAGVEFQPDAIISGRASFGIHRMEPRGVLAEGFNGATASVNISYVLLGRTRFNVQVARDTNFSVGEQPYFLQTIYGGDVLHNLAGPIDVIARASHETLDYPGIVDRGLAAYATRVRVYGGALAIRMGERSRITFNYETTDRLATQIPSIGYDRQRVYTTITYGF